MNSDIWPFSIPNCPTTPCTELCLGGFLLAPSSEPNSDLLFISL